MTVDDVHTTYIYTDGGCIRKPNEIPKGRYCYFVEGSNKAQLYYQDSITNNQAEYLAVLKLFEDNIISNPNELYIVYSDSEIMICQVNRTRAIKNAALLVFAKRIWEESAKYNNNIQFKWIPRSKNKAGDLLEKILLRQHNAARQGISIRY